MTPRRPALTVLTALGVLLTAALTTVPTVTASETQRRATVLDRRLLDERIVESSGLARSTYPRRTVWTHNDSGDEPRVFAVDREGRTRAVVRLRGATALDWEDISSGRGHQLWVADIGDNARQRGHVSVYRFTEPRTLGNRTVDAVRFDLAYPDGRHDAEGLAVRPSTGRLFVVTKGADGGIYRAPETLSRTRVNVLRRVGSVPAFVTGASFSPDGRRLVLVDYADAFFFRTIGGTRPVRRSKPSMAQGESVEFGRGGTAVMVGTEGSQSPVYRMSAP